MITLTEEQAQQIDEIIEHLLVSHPTARHHKACVEALSIIRAARAQVQAEQEPVMDYERLNALREGEQNGAEDAYFFVRPENDTPTLRKMFCQGFERGFHKGIKYAAPVSIESAVLAEREACAKVCEPVEGSAYEVGVYKTMQTLAAAIRARGETK